MGGGVVGDAQAVRGAAVAGEVHYRVDGGGRWRENKADKIDTMSALPQRYFRKYLRYLLRSAQGGRTGGEGLISPGGPATTLLAMGKSDPDDSGRAACRKCPLQFAASRKLPFGYRPHFGPPLHEAIAGKADEAFEGAAGATPSQSLGQ